MGNIRAAYYSNMPLLFDETLPRSDPHSALNDVIGSTHAARRAGIQQASTATATMTIERLANVSGSASGSEPVSVIATGVPSSVFTFCAFAVGGLFVDATLIDTVAGALVASPSSTVK